MRYAILRGRAMSRVECFWIAPSGTVAEKLRRYTPSDKSVCPLPLGYHDAEVVLGDKAWPLTDGLYGGDVSALGQTPLDHADPRWPAACACGHAFAAEDAWQHHYDRLYGRASGELYIIGHGPRGAPAGAMWDATWWPKDRNTQDKMCLVVRLPDGIDWMIDGPSAGGGGGWKRSGTPPNITARPSILSPRGYHGFLTDGVLVQC